MSNDIKTSVSGIVAGVFSILALFNIIIPQEASGIIVAIALVILGYFTNKKDK